MIELSAVPPWPASVPAHTCARSTESSALSTHTHGHACLVTAPKHTCLRSHACTHMQAWSHPHMPPPCRLRHPRYRPTDAHLFMPPFARAHTQVHMLPFTCTHMPTVPRAASHFRPLFYTWLATLHLTQPLQVSTVSPRESRDAESAGASCLLGLTARVQVGSREPQSDPALLVMVSLPCRMGRLD